tara:strand:+ start:1753 stop:2223 length:471 start_codon:yes stop_codon:yes gene_type:complete
MSIRQEALDLGTIDPAVLKRAEAVVERLRWVYIREWAPEVLSEMEAAVLGINQYAKRGPVMEGKRRDALLRLCHDMQGQAGTFGLELLADFATSMHKIGEASPVIRDRQADVLVAHIMAMRTALRAVAADPDGALSEGLHKELRRDLRKLRQKPFN